jgi:Tfp pilus assembly protein PilX
MIRRLSGRMSKDERGYVIVIVLWLMAVAMAFGAVGIAESLSSQRLTTHDTRARRAQQAADAGIQQQLYDQAENNFATAYNFTGGVLGLSNFLDCVPLQLNANLQVGGLTAYASTAGVCPTALNSSGSPVTGFWSALDNHSYYESEYLSNKKEVNGSGVGSVVEFPQVVSVGCDSATASSCNTTPAPSTNVYTRELALLQPTGPVQAIEGMGNVTVQGLTALGINAAAVVNGDIMTDGTLTLPALGVAADTTWPTSGNPIFPTFGYGQTPAPSSISTANVVHLTGGFCTAGNPSTLCMIKRPAPTTTATTCANCSTGITCASCTGGGYSSSNDTFTLTGGTATFAAGDYVFCNFNATGGSITTTPTSTTPVRIFILAPNQPPCSANSYTAAQEVGGKVGDFNATEGIGDGLSGVVNGVSGTLDPSGLQIYDEGDGSYDNNTSVTIGQPSSCASTLCISLANLSPQAEVIYAPTSAVTVNTGSCTLGLAGHCVVGAATTFAGSVVGDNVYVGATVITQDLDLGNYPIDSGANAVRADEYIQCDNSVTKLTDTTSDLGGC